MTTAPITTGRRFAAVAQALLGTHIFKQTEQRLVLWPVAFG
jgi:hypothetical protein